MSTSPTAPTTTAPPTITTEADGHRVPAIEHQVIEAETAPVLSNANVEPPGCDYCIGYSGTGFLGGWDRSGQHITIPISSESGGWAVVTIRYAAAGDARRAASINDDALADVTFEATRRWDQWARAGVIAPVIAGLNHLVLAVASDTSPVNVDHFEVAILEAR
jgi:hypothetical protein